MKVSKNIKVFVVSKILFTSLRLLNFNTQRNVNSCTKVRICIFYRAVGVLTSGIHSQQSFSQDERRVIYLTPTK